MRPLSVKLSGALIAKLTTIAEQKETTKSAVVRHALERALADRREPRGGSFLALARDLAGSVSGPSDLLTRSAHLKGYGE